MQNKNPKENTLSDLIKAFKTQIEQNPKPLSETRAFKEVITLIKNSKNPNNLTHNAKTNSPIINQLVKKIIELNMQKKLKTSKSFSVSKTFKIPLEKDVQELKPKYTVYRKTTQPPIQNRPILPVGKFNNPLAKLRLFLFALLIILIIIYISQNA